MTYFLSPIVGVADTFPEGESKICLFVFAREAKRRSKLPGGTKKYVILSMSSEQTCLQGFVSEDIHKAQAFCKNAKR